MDCFAFVKAVLLRRLKNSISQNTTPLTEFACFFKKSNLQYLPCENGDFVVCWDSGACIALFAKVF